MSQGGIKRNRRLSQIVRKHPTQSIGIVLGSGDAGHIVTQVDEKGIAFASGVRTGDILTSINDRDVTSMPHNDVIDFIGNAGSELSFGLVRDGVNQMVSGGIVSDQETAGPQEPLGISLVTGGAFGDRTGITRVDPYSPGFRAGLMVGDIITSVNGASVAGMSHQQILGMVKGSRPDELSIGVHRGQQEVTAATSTVMILDLGIVVERTAEGFVQVVEVFVNGAGEHAGLHVGDLLFECDGYSLVKLKLKRAAEILRSAVAATANLVVAPQPVVKEVIRGYQSLNQTSNVQPQFYTIQLSRLSLGNGEVESLAMGIVTEQQGPRGHTVSKVEKGGCADRSGILEGDRVTHVNGQSVVVLQHQRVLDLLKKSGMTFTIGIERPANLPAPPPTSQINGPRTVMETENFTELEM